MLILTENFPMILWWVSCIFVFFLFLVFFLVFVNVTVLLYFSPPSDVETVPPSLVTCYPCFFYQLLAIYYERYICKNSSIIFWLECLQATSLKPKMNQTAENTIWPAVGFWEHKSKNRYQVRISTLIPWRQSCPVCCYYCWFDSFCGVSKLCNKSDCQGKLSDCLTSQYHFFPS